jgi:hypothetical protein
MHKLTRCGFPELTMFRKRCIGVSIELRLESCKQGRAFLRRTPWNGSGFDVASLAPQLEIPFDRSL